MVYRVASWGHRRLITNICNVAASAAGALVSAAFSLFFVYYVGVILYGDFKLLKGVELMELNVIDYFFFAAIAIAVVVVLIHSTGV